MLDTLKNRYSEKLFETAKENGFKLDCELTNALGYMYTYFAKRDDVTIYIGHAGSGTDKGFRNERDIINNMINLEEYNIVREYEESIEAENEAFLRKMKLA